MWQNNEEGKTVQRKPLICISSDRKPLESDERRWLTQLHNVYTDAVWAAGGIPLPTCGVGAEELAQLCDGLLLSGGVDLDPMLYGEARLNDTVQIVPERDEFELALFRAFWEQGKPIFGICRGCQLINVALGGTLYQDLVEQKGLYHSDPELRHEVQTEEKSVLRQLFGESFFTNSTHHQAVKDAASGLRITARSAEGIVEAFEHVSRPVLATQFHPERLTGQLWDERTPDFAPLFSYFVDLCK